MTASLKIPGPLEQLCRGNDSGLLEWMSEAILKLRNLGGLGQTIVLKSQKKLIVTDLGGRGFVLF